MMNLTSHSVTHFIYCYGKFKSNIHINYTESPLYVLAILYSQTFLWSNSPPELADTRITEYHLQSFWWSRWTFCFAFPISPRWPPWSMLKTTVLAGFSDFNIQRNCLALSPDTAISLPWGIPQKQEPSFTVIEVVSLNALSKPYPDESELKGKRTGITYFHPGPLCSVISPNNQSRHFQHSIGNICLCN